MFLIEHVLADVSTAALATGTYGATGMALLMFMVLTHKCASVFAIFCTAFVSITSNTCSKTFKPN